MHINIRKDEIFKEVAPKKFERLLMKYDNDKAKAKEYIQKYFSLFTILNFVDCYQDKIKDSISKDSHVPVHFENYNQYIKQKKTQFTNNYNCIKRIQNHIVYFYEVIQPMIFENIYASIIEYQKKNK